jgi:hypothetical protein
MRDIYLVVDHLLSFIVFLEHCDEFNDIRVLYRVSCSMNDRYIETYVIVKLITCSIETKYKSSVSVCRWKNRHRSEYNRSDRYIYTSVHVTCSLYISVYSLSVYQIKNVFLLFYRHKISLNPFSSKHSRRSI